MDLKSLNEKDILEAALYLYDRPVTYEELSEIIQKTENEIERYIEEIRDEHLDKNTAYHIVNLEEKVVKFGMKLHPTSIGPL